MTDQLDYWVGSIGDTYTEENNDVGYFNKRLRFWSNRLFTLNIESILEVGCNRGHNLRLIKSFHLLLAKPIRLFGIEPNKSAAVMASEYATIANQSCLVPIG